MSKTTPTTIEVADNCVKLMQARSARGQGHVSSMHLERLNGNSDEDILAALREIAKHKNVRGGAYLVLPRHHAILKVLKLPSQDEREIRQMVDIQISNQTPYGLDEVEYEYRLLSRDDEGYSRVLLIVIPREVSNRFVELANKAGIPLIGLTISSVGLLGWYLYQTDRKRIEDEKAIAVCNIDENHSEICFFEKQRLLFSRSINLGLTELQANESEMRRQIELSLKYYHNEHMGSSISRLIMVSDQRDVQSLIGELEHQIQIPCELISTTDGITVPKNIQPDVLESDLGMTMTAAMGVQFADPKQLINLLPQTIRVSKVSKIRKHELVKLIVLGAVIYALVLFNWSRTVSIKEGEVRQLGAAITKLNPQIDEAKRKMKLIEFFDVQIKNRIFIPEIMRSLAAIVPEQISLKALYLDQKGLFTIQGYAETREALNEFQSNLVNEEIFENCNLAFATSRKIFNKQVTDFKFTCSLAEDSE